jgi:hypothetical protein
MEKARRVVRLVPTIGETGREQGRRRRTRRIGWKKREPRHGFHRAGFINSGDVLLSRNLEMHYHWGCSVSLPCSEWERVGPLRYDHQKAGEAEASPWGNGGAVSPQLHQKFWGLLSESQKQTNGISPIICLQLSYERTTCSLKSAYWERPWA